MLIQNVSLVCEVTIEILSKQTQIFKTFFFSSALSISTFGLLDKPNRLFTYKPYRSELQTSRPKGNLPQDNSPHIKLALRQLASNSWQLAPQS